MEIFVFSGDKVGPLVIKTALRAASRPRPYLTFTKCRLSVVPTFPQRLPLQQGVQPCHPVKDKTRIQCWFNVGPASTTLDQQ